MVAYSNNEKIKNSNRAKNVYIYIIRLIHKFRIKQSFYHDREAGVVKFYCEIRNTWIKRIVHKKSTCKENQVTRWFFFQVTFLNWFFSECFFCWVIFFLVTFSSTENGTWLFPGRLHLLSSELLMSICLNGRNKKSTCQEKLVTRWFVFPSDFLRVIFFPSDFFWVIIFLVTFSPRTKSTWLFSGRLLLMSTSPRCQIWSVSPPPEMSLLSMISRLSKQVLFTTT